MMTILIMRIISTSLASQYTQCICLCLCFSQLPVKVEQMSSQSPTLKPAHTWPSPLSSTSRCVFVLTLTKSSVSDQVKHKNTPSCLFPSLPYAVPILRSSLNVDRNKSEYPDTIIRSRQLPQEHLATVFLHLSIEVTFTSVCRSGHPAG